MSLEQRALRNENTLLLAKLSRQTEEIEEMKKSHVRLGACDHFL